ncbi:MAG: phosphate ABC transporter permease PstA [Peptococcaceae bacterium]
MKNNTKLRDNIQLSLAWLAAGLTIFVCLGIIIFLFIKGYQAINWEFLTTDPKPTFKAEEAGGILAPIAGTFIVTIISIMIALPWALATAIYLSEYASKNFVTAYFKLAVDVLSGVPTIVIAIFGVAIFTLPSLGFLSSMVEGVEGVQKAFGKSFLVVSIGMAVMILPYVIKTCEEAIKAVPQSYREASLALGASKWHTIVDVVIPSASRGIVTAVVLGMGRIIGDTAIVWLLLGGTTRMTGMQPWWHVSNWLSTLKNTGATLTTYIYFNSPAGEGNKAELAFGASLVLIVIIIFLNAVTDMIGSRNKVKEE